MRKNSIYMNRLIYCLAVLCAMPEACQNSPKLGFTPASAPTSRLFWAFTLFFLYGCTLRPKYAALTCSLCSNHLLIHFKSPIDEDFKVSIKASDGKKYSFSCPEGLVPTSAGGFGVDCQNERGSAGVASNPLRHTSEVLLTGFLEKKIEISIVRSDKKDFTFVFDVNYVDVKKELCFDLEPIRQCNSANLTLDLAQE